MAEIDEASLVPHILGTVLYVLGAFLQQHSFYKRLHSA
jgi:hypothetical protein